MNSHRLKLSSLAKHLPSKRGRLLFVCLFFLLVCVCVDAGVHLCDCECASVSRHGACALRVCLCLGLRSCLKHPRLLPGGQPRRCQCWTPPDDQEGPAPAPRPVSDAIQPHVESPLALVASAEQRLALKRSEAPLAGSQGILRVADEERGTRDSQTRGAPGKLLVSVHT